MRMFLNFKTNSGIPDVHCGGHFVDIGKRFQNKVAGIGLDEADITPLNTLCIDGEVVATG